MNTNELDSSLEKYYITVEKIILSRQDPITGLLPASTAITAHGDYTDAWVRDNVYSILCVWGLALSYRKYNPDHHRTYLLSQSVVKLMRGLLNSMMRQSSKVERFKNTLNPIDALHAKYGTNTGLPVVGDDEWGHLQLDATSLFLLMIAQMTASGLRLIYTIDEVNFVQNLVHYISRTYCTPDFGIWERGHKINTGATEVNCSSVGMAKAALEALDGFNLFGNVLSKEAVIHVIPSDIAHSRFTLEGLLPRESSSKETDAALLSIVGYPAYAVENKEIVEKTRDKIVKKLVGNYGCKRFLLDGHQSSIEDSTRLHYESSELREFEHIESEWPLFFTYFLLDALMREDSKDIEYWKKKIKPLFVEENGQLLLPELYIVPKELIDAEKENPGSQKRVPNENLPLVWAQSLYMLSDMILDGILTPSDIDPLHRRRRIGHKRSTTPMVAFLSENEFVKQQMLNLGFNSETLDDLSCVKILHASQLSEVHELLGKNDKLSLTGRPPWVPRSITTARLHILAGEHIIFLPYYFNPKGFYFSYDNKLLVEQFTSSLKFLSEHWDQPGQPILPFLIREDMLNDNEKDEVVSLLHDLQSGKSNLVGVKTGPLGQLLKTSAQERIDNLHGHELEEFHLNIKSRTFYSSSFLGKNSENLNFDAIKNLELKDDNTLIETLLGDESFKIKTYALKFLWKRVGKDFEITNDGKVLTLSSLAEHYYEYATSCHDWAMVRKIADITGINDDRLEDALLEIVIRQKRLAVGRAYSEKAIFSKPQEKSIIIKTIKEYCGNNDAENVLTQEIMLHLAELIRTRPNLFENIITIRTWYFVQLLVSQISKKENLPIGDAYEYLLTLAPHDIYDSLRSVLNSYIQETKDMKSQENLYASGISSLETLDKEDEELENPEVNDWLKWRKDTGMLARVSSLFCKDIWYMLKQCNGLIIGDKYNLNSRIGNEILLETTAGERTFELRIDSLIQSIDAPDYRQLNIEVLESLSRFLKNNQNIKVESDLVLDVIIGYAVRIAWNKENDLNKYDEQKGQAWTAFYNLPPNETAKFFKESFIYLLTLDNNEN
ncbi:MAG: glycosyl hydrolase family 15 [Arcobacter sp.]|mgnify:CR=1 FL=1|nr:MAG: glycosyl hydrolase family 15 [Arcobacter sp.]